MTLSDEDSDSDEEIYAIVIDAGSDSMKTGFAGDDAPRCVFPTQIGRPKVKSLIGLETKDFYVGDEAQTKRGILNMQYPIEKGVVTDWDAMEKLWQHTFVDELRVALDEYKVLLTDNIADQSSRQKMAEIMFETFKVPGLFVALQAVLSLCSTGRRTGLVVDSGVEVTNITPIYEGKVVERSMKRLEFGGKQITDYLAQLFAKVGYQFVTVAEKSWLNEIKKQLCQASDHFLPDHELKDPRWESQFENVCGSVFRFNGEHIRAVDALFNPALMGVEGPGIHEAVNDSILKCFPDPHPKHFIPNIVLSGGNTMFDGLQERTRKEMQGIISPSMVAKVIAPPERKYSVWIGGSIFASLSSTEEKWITLAEYEELGEEIVQMKCGTNQAIL